MPHVIEVTYLHKKFFENKPTLFTGHLPNIELDQPNRPGYYDILLSDGVNGPLAFTCEDL